MGSGLDLGCADVNHCGREAREANTSPSPCPGLSPWKGLMQVMASPWLVSIS